MVLLFANIRMSVPCCAVGEEAAEEAAVAAAAAAERVAAAAAGPTRIVHLTRPVDMEAARQQLPIIGHEQEIMEAISRHDVVVCLLNCLA